MSPQYPDDEPEAPMSQELVKYSISSGLGASFRCGLNGVVLEQGTVMIKAEDVARVFGEFLRADIAAFDYIIFHRTATMDGLLYESQNNLCPEHTIERRKAEAQRLLAGLEEKG